MLQRKHWYFALMDVFCSKSGKITGSSTFVPLTFESFCVSRCVMSLFGHRAQNLLSNQTSQSGFHQFLLWSLVIFFLFQANNLPRFQVFWANLQGSGESCWKLQFPAGRHIMCGFSIHAKTNFPLHIGFSPRSKASISGHCTVAPFVKTILIPSSFKL